MLCFFLHAQVSDTVCMCHGDYMGRGICDADEHKPREHIAHITAHAYDRSGMLHVRGFVGVGCLHRDEKLWGYRKCFPQFLRETRKTVLIVRNSLAMREPLVTALGTAGYNSSRRPPAPQHSTALHNASTTPKHTFQVSSV